MPGEPDGALLLHHIRQSHPAELTPFLDQMHADDDITPATLQAYEVVEASAHVTASFTPVRTEADLIRWP